MPTVLETAVAEAEARHWKRHASPGIAVEVETRGTNSYVIAAPHDNHAAWLTLLMDAMGTRSESTAKTLSYQLTKLCGQHWHPSDDEEHAGQWLPDETELNMILNVVAGARPRNEMQAMLVAQMCATHLMMMRAAERSLSSSLIDERTAATAGKLARTFAMQTDALAKLQGKRTTKQKIEVRYERHEHKHQHVHLEGGAPEIGGQPHGQGAPSAALPGTDQSGVVLPLPRRQG